MEYTFLPETHTIFQENGELHLVSENRTIIIDCETFYNDLPIIIKYVMQARQERTELIEKELIQVITQKTKNNETSI
jgi:hypothetical protein